MFETHAPSRRDALSAFVLAVSALSIALTSIGCGAPAQRTDGLWGLGGEAVDGRPALFSVIPAAVTYTLIADLDRTDAAMMRAGWGAQSLSAVGVFGEIERFTGVDFSRAEALEEIGVDLAGDYAVFSTAVAPVALLRLSDPDAFSAFIENVQSRNPDLDWGQVTVDDVVLTSVSAAPLVVDFGVIGSYAVLRARFGDATLDVSDDTLRGLFRGHAGAALADDARMANLLGRANAGERTSQVGFFTLDVLSRGIRAFDRLGDSWPSDAQTDAQLAACDAQVLRMTEAIPWLGGATFRNTTDPNALRGVMVAKLGERAAANAARVLQGTVADVFDVAADAALFLSGNLDPEALLSLATADPELRHCRDLATIPGGFAYSANSLRDWAEDDVTALDGSAAFALLDARFGGFVPSADAVLMVGTADPVALVENAQRLLEGAGATGSVDLTAPFTTLDYRLFGVSVRILQLEDRAVFSIGRVPVALANGLATAATDQPGAPFSQFRMNGSRFASIFEQLMDYTRASGAGTDEDLEALEQVTQVYRSIVWLATSARLVGPEIVVETNGVLDPTQLDQ